MQSILPMSLPLPFTLLLVMMILVTRNQTSSCLDVSTCPPINSMCSSGYCQCIGPFVLDCQVYAEYLSQAIQDINVTETVVYVQTQVQKPEIYFDFLFKVCCVETLLQNYNLSFSLWINQGYQTLSHNIYIGNLHINLQELSTAGACIDFLQYQTKFIVLPNGQTQNLLIGLSISPNSPADTVIDAQQIISINVEIKEFVSANFLVNLAIGIMTACVAIIVGVCVYCCYRRWRSAQVRKQTQTLRQRMIQKFKEQTPQILAKTITIPSMTTCTICLGEFEGSQKVRKIICKHVFHVECIDSWCTKNLSCPVCRLELDQISLKNKKKQIQMADFKWNQNSLRDREELMHHQTALEAPA